MSSFVIAIPSLGRTTILKNQTLSMLAKENIPKEIIHIFIIQEEEELYRNELKDMVLEENIHIGLKGYQHSAILFKNHFQKILTSFVLMMMLNNGYLNIVMSFIIIH